MFKKFYHNALADMPPGITWWPRWAQSLLAAWLALSAVLFVRSVDHGLAENPVREWAWLILAACWGVLPFALVMLVFVLLVLWGHV